MNDFYLNASARLKIELVKADALREVRPLLQEPERGSWFRRQPSGRAGEQVQAIKVFLERIVQAHLHSLLGSQILSPDVDIEAFTKRAIEDAKSAASHSAVD